MASALASLTALHTLAADASQAPEVPNYSVDVPPDATFWCLVMFTADEPMEITLAAGKILKSLRGRFDGQRLAEYSWHNAGDKPARVAVRAKALAGDRELPAARVQFLSEQNVYVGFGQRATPDTPADRRGGYPHEAVLVGFIVFGDGASAAL